MRSTSRGPPVVMDQNRVSWVRSGYQASLDAANPMISTRRVGVTFNVSRELGAAPEFSVCTSHAT
eukprot:CAMPEP_0119110402 /NCGR_PEP_ID=MMETSP1180-20130426/29426_1 /TAXON_ID=3052 ORGANISM="Chlamydomonas cf sp, Strain CCMP681" /NCGR_SAMPLE_ID=MMETSP1180 /ASSEMBLY_ACC=CAM_ASM_000741 /LENGTH=64 /DNA_ID=CAMNT_0007096731 /DNA_START=1477 /DNA_END=1671 /DNA_ORIENTATION=-